MEQIFKIKVKSLLSPNLIYAILIFIVLLTGYEKGLKGMLSEAESMGGLWLIIIVVFLGFAETFYNLAGHRLEISNGNFCFKTLRGTIWSYPISSIQAIDANIKKQRKKRPFFSFQTDNKIFQCDYEPVDYQKLIGGLKTLNPNIEIKNIESPLNPLQAIGKTPLNLIAKKISWPIVILISMVLLFAMIYGIIITSK